MTVVWVILAGCWILYGVLLLALGVFALFFRSRGRHSTKFGRKHDSADHQTGGSHVSTPCPPLPLAASAEQGGQHRENYIFHGGQRL